MDSLKHLTSLTPDADRSERVRLQCRMQLKRSDRRGLSPAVVGVVVSLLYTAAFVFTTLRLEGLIQ